MCFLCKNKIKAGQIKSARLLPPFYSYEKVEFKNTALFQTSVIFDDKK